MSRRFPRYGVLLLFLATLSTACDKTTTRVTAPTTLAAMQSGVETTFTTQPATLRPEFLPGVSCIASPAFGTRVLIIVSGQRDAILRGLRFQFTDRLGVTALPAVSPIPGTSPLTVPPLAIPAASPIPFPGVAPLPSSAPISIPGSSPINGTLVPANSSLTLPFFLTFGCGLFSDGTLVVFADESDMTGHERTSRLTLKVGS